MASTKSAEYKLAIQIAGSIASSFNSSVGGAQSKLSALGKAAGNVMKVAAAASAAAATAVGAFAASSVQTGMEFDSAMSQVAATMGKTTDEIQELRDFAQEMGATTAFSATEAAEALNYMALAGYDADTSMAMLPNVLNLAAAGAIDLASASDMITDAQSALGLTLDQTTVMVDQMAAASSKSNTSVAQLGEAILTVGGTAQYMAGGTQELNTVLGVLADNGIKGSEGGTHLRNMLLKLASPTADATKLLNNLGVQVFDAQGDMRSFTEIFPELNAAMSNLTDQERLDAMATLFNSRDIASATALLGTTTERWEELGAAIGDSAGAAEQMAQTQLDNLKGDITLFQSALEGAQIALSDQLTPSLREFVQFGSEGLSELTTAFREGGLEGAMDALGGILSDGLNIIVEQVPGFMGAGMQLLGALGQGILDNLPTMTSAALTVALMLVDGLVTAFPALAEGGTQLILQLALGIADAIPELVPAIVSVVFEIINTLTSPDTLTALLGAALAIILALGDGLIEALPDLIAAIPVIVQNLATALAAAAPQIIAAGVHLFGSLVSNLPAILAAILSIIPAIVNGILGAFGSSGLGSGLAGIFRGALDGIKDAFASVGAFFSGVWNSIKAVWSTVAGWFQSNVIQPIVNFFQPIVETISGIFRGCWIIIQAIWVAVSSWFQTNVITPLISFFTNAVQAVSGFFSWLWSSIQGIWQTVASWFQDNVITPLVGFFAPIVESIGGFFSGLWDNIVSVWQAAGAWFQDNVATPIQNAFQAVSDFVKGIFNGLLGFVEKMINSVIGAINSFIGGFSGIVEKAASFIGVDWGGIAELPQVSLPRLAEGGIVTGPTFLEAGEAGDEAIIPLSELWGNMQSIVADAIGGYTGQLAALTEQLEMSNAGTMSMPISDLLADLVGDDEPPEDDGGGNDDDPPPDGDGPPPLVIYYQPHLHFEGGTPSRDDIVEAGRISQEEFNRMAARWQKDMARLSLKE